LMDVFLLDFSKLSSTPCLRKGLSVNVFSGKARLVLLCSGVEQ
jgi:hypothetical protein